MDGRANPLIERKVVGAMFFGVAARSRHPQLLGIVSSNVVVAVV